MAWLPDDEKISKMSLVVLAQLTNVTDRRTDGRTNGQTPGDSKDRAYASHRTVKMKWPKVVKNMTAFHNIWHGLDPLPHANCINSNVCLSPSNRQTKTSSQYHSIAR